MEAVFCCWEIIDSIPCDLEGKECKDEHDGVSHTAMVAEVEGDKAEKPGSGCPVFFGIPTPIVTPCLTCPYCSCQHTDDKEG